MKTMPRPRDSQRSKAYDAERAVKWPADMPRWKEISEVQKVVDKLCASAWWKRRWPRITACDRMDLNYGRIYHQPAILIKPGRNGGVAYSDHSIGLGVWGRQMWILCHEIAHVVTPNKHAAHGREWAANYLVILQHMMGKEVADELRRQFRAHKVKYTKAPNRAPLSEERKAQLRDQLAAARSRRGETWPNSQDSSATSATS
jgi:putative metallohydrolase (TIGR04338 family)